MKFDQFCNLLKENLTVSENIFFFLQFKFHVVAVAIVGVTMLDDGKIDLCPAPPRLK